MNNLEFLFSFINVCVWTWCIIGFLSYGYLIYRCMITKVSPNFMEGSGLRFIIWILSIIWVVIRIIQY
jgi:hypothetical protein